MTRLLFVINDSPQLMVDSPLPLDELITAINAGEWQFPAQTFNLPSTALHASRLGDLIIVAPVQPLEQVTPPANDVLTLGLSQRQRQVLEGIAEGLSSKQIAARLGVGVRTVEFHVATLKNRFGTSTRAQSVSDAISAGLYPSRHKTRPTKHDV
jgi:DNA-binding NarL/FixJ family response regulator